MKRVRLFITIGLCLISFNIGAFAMTHISIITADPTCTDQAGMTVCTSGQVWIAFH